jgi:predicted nuclease of predicted toxin-antitoxin system
MHRFLIDVNLPYRFGLWNDEDYVHQVDIDPTMKDKYIWAYAKSNDLTIITKDSDFSHRIMFSEPPPRVIHIRFGNMGMAQFHARMHAVWEDVIAMSREYKLVNVYQDRIEGLN